MSGIREVALLAQGKLRARMERERFKTDPGAWAEYKLGYTMWSKQREMGQSIIDNPQTMVAAGHGLGKSMGLAALACWWVDTHWDEDVFLATTAPSASQVGIIWTYIQKFHALSRHRYEEGLIDSALPGYVTASNQWKTDTGIIVGEGRKPPDRNVDSAFQGRHADYLLALIDEAVGVPKGFIDAIGNMATAVNNRQIMIANPTDLTSEMYRLWEASENGKANWHRLTMSVFDSPRMVDDPFLSHEDARGMSGPEFVERAKTTYGEDSPAYLARVKGEWAQDTGDTVYSAQDIAKAHNTVVVPWSSSTPQLGCDVARMGCFDDQTEILTDQGWKLFEDLTGSECVLSQNLEDGGRAEWMPITQIHRYQHTGTMNVFEGRRLNFSITDNHRLITSSLNTGAPFSIKRFDQHRNNFKVKMTTEWEGYNPESITFEHSKQMPRGGSVNSEYTYDYEDWAEFLGWFVSEGNVYWDSRGRAVICISQNRGANYDRIAALLDRMGFTYRYATTPTATGGSFQFYNRAVADYLDEHCGVGAHNKRVPTEIKNASVQVIRKFLESFCAGDGSIGSRGQVTYTSSSRKLLDDIQEMQVKLGIAGSLVLKEEKGSTSQIEGRTLTRKHDTYSLYQRQSPTDSMVDLSKVRREEYDGYVYCVSTPWETIVVRRNGKVLWSGNSDLSVVYKMERGEVWETDELTGKKIRATGVEGIRLRRVDSWSKAPITNGPADNPDTTSRIHQIAGQLGASVVKVDASGIGASVIDGLSGYDKSYDVVEIYAGSTSIDNPKSYRNLRAEMAFTLKYDIQRGIVDLDPEDTELTEELSIIQYERTESDLFKLESKDDMKRRGLKSPDYFDAMQYAYVNVDHLYEEVTDRGYLELDEDEFDIGVLM